MTQIDIAGSGIDHRIRGDADITGQYNISWRHVARNRESTSVGQVIPSEIHSVRLIRLIAHCCDVMHERDRIPGINVESTDFKCVGVCEDYALATNYQSRQGVPFAVVRFAQGDQATGHHHVGSIESQRSPNIGRSKCGRA